MAKMAGLSFREFDARRQANACFSFLGSVSSSKIAEGVRRQGSIGVPSGKSRLSIVQDGLNLEKALANGGDGAFWTTTAVEDAEQFAVVNPAGGSPAVIQVQVPAKLINNLVNDGLLTIGDSVYQFSAGAYDRLNEFATFLLKG
jgi:hypothetical protein